MAPMRGRGAVASGDSPATGRCAPAELTPRPSRRLKGFLYAVGLHLLAVGRDSQTSRFPMYYGGPRADAPHRVRHSVRRPPVIPPIYMAPERRGLRTLYPILAVSRLKPSRFCYYFNPNEPYGLRLAFQTRNLPYPKPFRHS